MYRSTCVYLTFLGKIPDICGHRKCFWTVLELHVANKVPDIDCSYYFMVLYLGKIFIISKYVNKVYLSWAEISCS